MEYKPFLLYLQNELRYSSHTIVAYEKDLQDFVEFLLKTENALPLTQVKKLHLRNFIIYLSEQNLQSKSINRKISSLKRYYNFLLKNGLIQQSPASTLKNLKIPKKVILPFSEKEMEHVMLQYSEDNYHNFQKKLIVELLYQTGMRRAELIDLTLERINFSTQQIKVLGKRNKERLIPISTNLVQLLKDFINLKENEEIRSSYLFSLKSGKKLYPKFVYNVVKSYLGGSTTKEKKSPHMLRHTFATHILNNGAEINSVKELLGHDSLASTQVYTHQDIETLKKVFKENHPREINQKQR